MSELKIYPAMIQVMNAIGSIGKDQDNKQQGFKFRGIDQVYNALHKHMADAGIFTTSEILDESREERTTKSGSALAFTRAKIRYTFYALDGSSVNTTVIGEGMDSGDKASNKAMAVAHKYALLQAFMVPTEEQKDPDAETHEVAPRKPQINEQLVAHIKQTLKDDDHFGLLAIKTKYSGKGWGESMQYLRGEAKVKKDFDERAKAMLLRAEGYIGQSVKDLTEHVEALNQDAVIETWENLSGLEQVLVKLQLGSNEIEYINNCVEQAA